MYAKWYYFTGIILCGNSYFIFQVHCIVDTAINQCLIAVAKAACTVQTACCCWQGVHAAKEPTRNAGGLSITHGEQKQGWYASLQPTPDHYSHYNRSRRSICVVGCATLFCCPCSRSCCCSPFPTSLSLLSNFI